ncbi:molybdopterin-dependent oxidoreductase [Segniliparus rugosus]|uniref:4Fe-4S Mo/W bis-MGD-type domain-containing protein n=1 Tax=Segniliparus rugosus (strain ATCC BAA-974 / DSM 45345 / CCUG 50838 / CIP 108380 / JCM 13579 / CDC 945) TaxID=679197 RepID=E5XKI5_SEGRC|nr:molybdopterin-dependent oxidoreductase [Segniliparus rugosus]EFV15097.1 hypothetical protein HMPREF9336_00003 [Segniliparus rugosus ATCC BAA-974]
MDIANSSSTPQGATVTRSRRTIPLTTKTSACILCECNCGIKIDLDGRRFATIRGDKEHPGSQGYTCEKAMRLDYYQNDAARLTSPLKRTPEGEYVPIGWDQALDEIAAKLAEIKERHGPGKLLAYASGQGDHMGLAGVASVMGYMESPFASTALAQEKAGEVWVDTQMYGTHTKGNFEHAQVLFFLGKNPWQTHSFPKARPVLREAARDPERTLIVVDPRLSESAEIADIHLRVKPGRDAWLLAAMVGVLVQEDLVDHDFLAKHTTGSERVLKAFRDTPVAEFAEISGVPEELVRRTARVIAAAESASFYEDLGVQQSAHSTLVSYLDKMLWILTGNFARKGCQQLHSFMIPLGVPSNGKWWRRKKNSAPLPYPVPMWAYRAVKVATGATKPFGKLADRAVSAALASPRFAPRFERAAKAALDLGIGLVPKGLRLIPKLPDGSSPVTGARIISGQIPCNSLTEEILTDHPDRFRALFVVSGNPAHSLAESARWRAAMRALELSVVVDVAFTETAQLADYVLPASSQFEKAEATFFNFEFPQNVFHLRKPVLDPLQGTLTEAEIFARLSQRFGILDEPALERLRRAWKNGPNSYLAALAAAVAAKPSRVAMLTTIVHETIGQDMDESLRPAAIMWFACIAAMFMNGKSLARAGFTGKGLEPATKLYEKLLSTETGVVFTQDDWGDSWNYVTTPGKKIRMVIEPLLQEVATLQDPQRRSWTSAEFPLVLIAGHRRSYTANTIIRDPVWRRRGGDGALQISKVDAAALGLSDGDPALLTTKGGSVVVTVEVGDIMLPGNVALPNGMGTTHPGVLREGAAGVGPNELTSIEDRDPIAGTPWHKHVPARLEALSAAG